MKSSAGRIIPTTVAELCDPRVGALVVYDMQLGVVAQIDDGDAVVTAVGDVLDAARAAGILVFFTRHCWVPPRYAGVAQQRRAMVWQRKSDPDDTRVPFEIGSDGWQIVPRLAPRPDEVVIDKITMSCFAATPLDLIMRDAGILGFAIAGIALEVGIEPSVRHALDLNFVPLVVADACGSRDPLTRARSMETLQSTGEVLTAGHAEVVSRLRNVDRAR